MRLIDREALLLDVRGMNDGWRDPKPAYDVETLIKNQPTIEAVPIKPLCAWLAGYAAPPNYALEAICNDIDPATIVYTANDRARAWEYHWKHLMECGLLQEDNHGETGDM